VAAIADCFVLSFRAIARASKLSWTSLSCDVERTLERVERTTRFTTFAVRASLHVPAGTDAARAERLLHKAEAVCLITNSLSGETRLEATVEVDA
jgi:organic hydroperoxide reductase OsmC/OhrA